MLISTVHRLSAGSTFIIICFQAITILVGLMGKLSTEVLLLAFMAGNLYNYVDLY